MAVALSPKVFSPAISNSSDKPSKPAKINSKTQHISVTPLRRRILVSGGVFSAVLQAVNLWSTPPPARAEEESDGGGGIVEAIESMFDPNERTKKTGKSLPKAYLKSARELVKNLRESLKEDPSEMAKFRRTADSAKDSIREFLGSWRGQQSVAREESYAMLEKAIRSLAGFYSKAGPSAIMPEEVKSEILMDLDSAEEYL